MASDMSSDPSMSNLKKDERFWIEDGNIIIAARNAVAFRVHKSLLAMASPFFRDLFAVGSANAPGTELVDGCPVIPVLETSQDLRAFLALIFGMTLE